MPSQPYQISTLATRADGHIEATIQGPGLRASGQREVFISRERAAAFVQAMNLAFTQGYTEGLATVASGLPRKQAGNAPA